MLFTEGGNIYVISATISNAKGDTDEEDVVSKQGYAKQLQFLT